MEKERQTVLPKSIWWAIGGIIAIFVVGLAISAYVVRARAKQMVAAHAGNIDAGVAALQNLDFSAAAAQFKLAAGSSTDLQVAGSFFSMVFSGKNPVTAFIDLSGKLASLASAVNVSERDLFSFASGAPNQLPADAASMRDILHGIDADMATLSAALSLTGARGSGGGDILSLITRLHSAETFMDSFAPWLADSRPKHILVLLQNPAELRPTGGFLGSYADITIASGTVADISVHDIADVDAGFTRLVVPPKPLQLEVSRWRPADANWFFDFPTSASKTVSFFEQSDAYAASSTTFDAVIAISPRVVSDLLSLAGSLTVRASTTPRTAVSATFTSDNFLVQIQKIVQAGQAQSATYPKQVLVALADALSSDLASSTDTEKQQLAGMAARWIADKDIMVYAKDSAFQNFATGWGATGAVYDAPQDFEGDYFALVDTNINGQKSDLYMTEDVNLQSSIGTDGVVTNRVIVVRTHHGNISPYWWYRATNQSYVQIFTPDGSMFTNGSGGMIKKISAPLDYARKGYTTDPLVTGIESSTQSIFGYPAFSAHEESGKTVFATWSRVAAGASATLAFEYSHRLFLPPADGTVYQFVFDKQPGTAGGPGQGTLRHYHFEIDAPLGYIFAETGIASWTYDGDNPPGRLIQNLTLRQIGE